MTVHFYGLVHWEDPMDEALGPAPCHCSAPEGTITKEGVLHYKAGTSYLGKEHWKTCFVVLRWEQPLWARGCVRSLAGEVQGADASLLHGAVGHPGLQSFSAQPALWTQDSRVPEPALVTDLQLCPGFPWPLGFLSHPLHRKQAPGSRLLGQSSSYCIVTPQQWDPLPVP